MGWAMFGNKVLLTSSDPNFMYLERNGLPGDIGGKYYFLIYVAIFFFIYACIFMPIIFYRHRHGQPQNAWNITTGEGKSLDKPK